MSAQLPISARLSRRAWRVPVVAMAAALSSGCGTAPPSPPLGPLPPPVITARPTAVPGTPAELARPAPPARFTPLAAGTRLSYLRRDVGSFGQGETRLQVQVGDSSWNGRKAVSFTRAQGSIDLQEPDSGKLLAVLAADGRPAITYDPPLGYEPPLSVGKTWTIASRATTTATRQVTPVEVRYTVQALEDLTVPAGTWRTWRIHQVDQSGEEQRVWVTVEHGLAIKRSVRRSAQHPQGLGAREVELTALVAGPAGRR